MAFLILSDEFALAILGYAAAVVFAICLLVAVLLLIQKHPIPRTIGTVLIWFLALIATLSLGYYYYVGMFVFFSPLLFGVYKAFSWLRKWGR